MRALPFSRRANLKEYKSGKTVSKQFPTQLRSSVADYVERPIVSNLRVRVRNSRTNLTLN